MPYFFLDLEVFLSVFSEFWNVSPVVPTRDEDEGAELAGRGWTKLVDRSFSRPEATMG